MEFLKYYTPLKKKCEAQLRAKRNYEVILTLIINYSSLIIN